MKAILAISACFIYLSADKCGDVPVRAGTRSTMTTIPPPTKDTINFTKQIQPILQKNCSPCHFTGGKMYEKMPFDASQTLLSHKEGILRRIKQEEENGLLKQYIDQRSEK
ncbi:MAG TPA: hypothetical protein VFZ47_00535 [Chitinophagaceae bacterium]